MNERDYGEVISKDQLVDMLLKLKDTRLHVQHIFRTKPSYEDICTYVNQIILKDAFILQQYVIVKERKRKDIRFMWEKVTIYHDAEHSCFNILHEDENVYHIIELFYACKDSFFEE